MNMLTDSSISGQGSVYIALRTSYSLLASDGVWSP